MKHNLRPVFAIVIFALFVASSVQAENEMIIALKTDQFELTETDISDLAVGEAKTIETESGSVIDILRTADGAEIYLDGELLEMDFDHGEHDGEHMVKDHHVIKKHVEVICDDDEGCDDDVITIVSGDEDGENVFIHKEIEVTCSDGEEGVDCDERVMWISDGEDIDLEELHGIHDGEEGHKVIVIKKKVINKD